MDKIKLDFNLLPSMNYAKAWFTLDQELQNSLVRFPSTLSRAKNAVKFSYFVSLNKDFFSSNEIDSIHLKEGFLRAALSEFVSIDDIFEKDLAHEIQKKKRKRWFESKNPLIHIIHELRNFEIHLNATKLSAAKRNALWGNLENPEQATPLIVTIWTVEDLSKPEFLKLRNARNYSDMQIEELLTWFNSAQKEWGVNDLIFKAIEAYCREIIIEK